MKNAGRKQTNQLILDLRLSIPSAPWRKIHLEAILVYAKAQREYSRR
jgi:hypothetical protein